MKWCEQAFDALLASLDARGAREAALTAILHRLEGSLRIGMRMNSGNGHTSLSQSKELVVSQNQVVVRGLAMKGTISSIHIPQQECVVANHCGCLTIVLVNVYRLVDFCVKFCIV